MNENFFDKGNVRFVSMGTIAPPAVPVSEIWLDVGGRNYKNVFDHHFESVEIKKTSTAKIVFERQEELSKIVKGRESTIQVVTHANPDLDSYLSLWLTRIIIENKLQMQNSSFISRVIDIVTDYDQGLDRSSAVFQSLPTLFILNCSFIKGGDYERLKTAASLFSCLCERYNREGNMTACYKALLNESTERLLNLEMQHYKEDVLRAVCFDLPLLRSNKGTDSLVLSAIHVENPSCGLLKNFARSGWGDDSKKVPVVATSKEVSTKKGASKLWRHIISVDPLERVNFGKLGEYLSAAEKPKWALQDDVVEVGDWYGGDGHNRTIVDSPKLNFADGESIIGSRLTPQEFRRVTLNYFDGQRSFL